MCIVPSLQCQRGRHSSLRTVRTPAHLVRKLRDDLHARTKTCTRWHGGPMHPHCDEERHRNVRPYTFSAAHTHERTSQQVSSCIAGDLLAILHSAKVATSSADPALQLRDGGTAFASTSPTIPQHTRLLRCQSPLMKVLIQRLEGA